ncbi:bifunctional (p)ppGpp synthetase/guanosine-3',5'-bis(diphosphate) 3'-pyrophosphohydrolase, partial [Acinetobacter baumannii]|nr:bifunctional (p)ppGpp synthetase/guanosine-3',5'-bis(diphosphate) 3'-pyrophosphohydrolase [Acinetobacter baumannii]
LVSSVPERYHSLGIFHQIWRHIPHQFDDYITNPQASGYRSLHTAVIAENKSLEVQLRTHEMHDEAEFGVCSHFNYQEGS